MTEHEDLNVQGQPPASATATNGWSKRHAWLHLALLAVAVALTFSNTLDNGLYLDDGPRVAGNVEIERFWPPWRHFFDIRTSSSIRRIAELRPLLPLSLSVDVLLSRGTGLDRLTVHHLINMGVHLANSVLLYLLSCELLLSWSALRRARSQRTYIAFGAALLFAVHPIAGEPVNYICSRVLSMMLLFLLAGLLVYIRMRRSGETVWGWAASLALVTLSVFSKQNAAVVPALVFSFEFFVVRERLLAWRAWVRSLAFTFPVFVFLMWSRFLAGREQLALDRVDNALTYTATQLKLHVFHYLRNIFWPFRLRMLPEVETNHSLFEPAVLAGILFVATTTILAFVLRRRAPVVSWCIAAYWILLVPTSSIPFRPMHYLAADYRQYPSLAFFFLAFVLFLSVLPGRNLLRIAVPVFALYFAVSAFSMNRNWRSMESVWEQSVRYGGTAVAEMNYGYSLQSRHQELAKKHFVEALRKSPILAYGYINLGLLYQRMGKIDEGLLLVQLGVDHGRTWGTAHYWLAHAYRVAGRLDKARDAAIVAADLDPRGVRLQYRAGLDLVRAGRFSKALTYLERASAYAPGFKDVLFLEAFSLQKLGRWPEAEAKYKERLRRQPEDSKSLYNLVDGLIAEGRCDDAASILKSHAQSDQDDLLDTARERVAACDP